MARLTDVRIELDESRKVLLDEKLQFLSTHLHDQPEVTITFFEPDEKKDGGAYRIAAGRLRKVDDYARKILLGDGTGISIDQIFEIESPLFESSGMFGI